MDSARAFLGQRPSIGAATVAKEVADDARALVRAEIALAKAEFSQSAAAKGKGAGLLGAAGAIAWLGLQGLLITIGFALALVMPGWAAALVVTLLLFAVAGVAALMGRKKLATPLRLDTTKQNVEEDVQWTKAHLPGRQ